VQQTKRPMLRWLPRGLPLLIVVAAIASTSSAGATGGSSGPGLASAPWIASPAPGLHAGDSVSVDGVTLLVPDPGQGAWGIGLRIDGRPEALGVENSASGSVTLYRWNDEFPAAPGSAAPAAPAAPGACVDTAYRIVHSAWTTAWGWYFNINSTPGGVIKTNAELALRSAATNLTGANNNCGMSDGVSAKHVYRGRTSRSVNISTGAGCLGSDGVSVVGFGDLPAYDIGFVCWWTWGGRPVSADMRLNKFDYGWVVNIGPGCVTRYSVEAVATHELGHVFGLGDLSEVLHGNLTMSLVIRPCQTSEETLGKGDVYGMEHLY